MENRYLNLHVLISHSPSCLNRDDMNMQKSARFGGVRRVRVSSQCLKRAIRKSDRYGELMGESSTRTRSDEALLKHLRNLLRFESFSDDELNLVIKRSGMQNNVVTPWMMDEIETIVKAIHSVCLEKGITAVDLGEVVEKASAKEKTGNKALDIAMDKAVEEVRKTGISCADIALAGRMCASGILPSIEGALSLSHSITTHAMEAEIDWFTAMDDLTQETEETGAGHLNTQEFGSGVFYRYASINLEQLSQNLGGDMERTLRIAGDFAELLATVVPTGKQRSFASYVLADLVFAVRSNMPIALHNAFEKPVSGKKIEGLMGPSIKALGQYWNLIYSGYGLKDRSAVFSLREETDLRERVDTLQDLLAWIKK
ncbi:MAG: type I-E CRISPR-associated protein Cas7/Cse4/CasC [Dethiosulfovibrio peptidovorans]|nr:MAG: type I-E CRISPR-associated protein Cas7/Cse4/CasC [Dethiosulfovibrio peptidovorans]